MDNQLWDKNIIQCPIICGTPVNAKERTEKPSVKKFSYKSFAD